MVTASNTFAEQARSTAPGYSICEAARCTAAMDMAREMLHETVACHMATAVTHVSASHPPE